MLLCLLQRYVHVSIKTRENAYIVIPLCQTTENEDTGTYHDNRPQKSNVQSPFSQPHLSGNQWVIQIMLTVEEEEETVRLQAEVEVE
jgi:hypothetical protein